MTRVNRLAKAKAKAGYGSAMRTHTQPGLVKFGWELSGLVWFGIIWFGME